MASDQNFGQYYTQSDKPTDVNIIGISARALEGIVNSINSLKSSVENLSDDFDEERARAERRARQEVASGRTEHTNQERRQRAANAALFGKIDKHASALDITLNALKSAINALADIVGDNFKKSIAAFQDLSKTMRERNLTRDQKNLIQQYVTNAQAEIESKYGVKVMGAEVNQFFTELMNSNKDLTAMRDEQRAVYAVLRKRGMSEELAYRTALSTNKENTDAILASVKSMSDYNISARVFKTLEGLTQQQISQMGGIQNAINTVTEQQKNLGQYRNWLNVDASAEIGKIAGKLASGQLEAVSEQEKTLIAKFGNTGSAEDMAKSMIGMSADELKTFARIMESNGGLSESMQTAIASLQELKRSNADQIIVPIREDQENKDADEQNTMGGRLAFGIDKLVRGTLGGLLGPLANWTDEMFGENLQIEQIVSNGFTTVVEILGAIAAGKFAATLFPGIGTAIRGAIPIIGKGLITVLSKLPVIGAFIAMVTSVGAAIDTWNDSKSRYENIEKTSADLKEARKNKADYEEKLERAKKMNNERDIEKYSKLLAEVNASIPELEKAVQDAEDNRTVAHKTYVDYSKQIREQTSALADERNEYTAKMQEAQASGNTEAYDYWKAKHDEVEAQRKKLWDQDKIVEEESESFIIKRVSHLFSLFGKTLSAESMIAWREFKDGIANTVKGWGTSIANGFKSVGSTIASTVKSLGTSLAGGASLMWDNAVKNFTSLKNLASTSLSYLSDAFQENFVEPVSKFFEPIGNWLNENFINPLKDFFEFEWLPDPIKKFLGIGGSQAEGSPESYTAGDMLDDLSISFANAVDDALDGVKHFWDDLWKFADGGVVNKATPSIIGEAGKEAVLPLTRPNAMASVLKSLSDDEKYALIKSLVGSGGNLTKLDFIKALFSAVFGGSSSKQTESAESLVSNELAQNIIAGAAAQKGHSYTEMVCNQLVEAALRYAGFQPPTTGVVTKHFNHPSMHLVLNDPVHGISPNDPALLPGMILFSHPFTQAEADQLNRTKGGRRKAGDPGHMGIYAGNGLWWNSTSSKRFVDYSSGNGINSTASGVALTKPYLTGTYKLYAAGYYDGMFGTSETRGLPHATANKSFASDIDAAISSTGLLSDNEIRSIKKSAGNDPAMKQYIDQATKLLTSGNHGDIVAILVEIARYLKGIASAPANKSPLFSASRPNIPVFQ